MRWRFSAQRRADDFDALVTGGATGDSAADRDGQLLTLVEALRGTPEVHARPEFVDDLRARLMAEAETALAPATLAPATHIPATLTPADLSRLELPARHTRRERRIAALVGGIAILGATTSVAVASQSALPGESLYPIKRVIESAHTGVSFGEADRGSTLLGSASSRLSEAATLSERGESGDRVAQALTTFVDQTNQGAELLLADYERAERDSSIVRVRTFIADGLADLQALEPVVPYDARDELLTAAALLTDLDAAASELCPACDTAPAAVLPQALAAIQIGTPTSSSAPAAIETEAESERDGDRAEPAGPDLPDVDPSDVGPGSVADPTPTFGQDSPISTHPLTSLTDGLHGIDSRSKARVPIVSDVVDGVEELLQGVLEPILDPITGKLLGTSTDSGDSD